MAETPEPDAVDDVSFFDPVVNRCPYPAYRQLRDNAPVWKDPATGMFVITRYEDVRSVLLDTERFSNDVGSSATRRELALRPENPEAAPRQAELASRATRLRRIYEDRGWLPAPNLDALDAPRHMQQRRLFNRAFRPSEIAKLDGLVAQTAYEFIDAFMGDGQCEWVEQFAVPFPLRIIGRMMGVPDEDLPRIKRWTDAFVQRMSLTQSEEETLASVELELEAQQYFQSRFEELRGHPDDSLLSMMVNHVIPEWGRPLNDNELHGEVMSDLFVGGAETTTNALSAGVLLLTKRPELWRALKVDPEGRVEAFVEEVLRIESPVQSLLRKAAVDIEMHGLTIPAGAIVNVRYGAANRDERAYVCAESIDLDRERPRRHLAFGVGAHHCLGAPLARRELYFGFMALLDRVDDVWLMDDANDLEFRQNYFLRGLNRLLIGFEPVAPKNRAGAHPRGSEHNRREHGL